LNLYFRQKKGFIERWEKDQEILKKKRESELEKLKEKGE